MLAIRAAHAPMDPFGHKRHDSDRLAEVRDPQGRASPRQQRQQQLPSFREVVLPSLNRAIESATTESTLSNRLPQLQTSGQTPFSRPPGSNISSPIQSQSSSMPDSFDELGQKNYESVNHFPTQRPSTNWPGTSNYQEMATSYAQRQPFYHQGMGQMKHESGLPPIRDMPFASPTIPSPSYSTVFGGSPQAPVPMDYATSYRRPSYNDGRGLSQTYPPYTRPYSMDKYEPSFRNQTIPHPVYSQPYTDYQNNYHTSLSHGSYHSMDHDVRNKKRRGNLPKPVTDILRQWLMSHMEHPYPTEEEKLQLIERTGLSMPQISNWFINARRRHLPAMKEKAQVQNKLKQDPERLR